MPDLPEIPLPAFLQPRPPRPLDDLPESSPDTSHPDATPESPAEPAASDQGEEPRPAPIESSPAPPAATRTHTSATSADPNAAGRAIAGVLVILAGIAAGALARAGRHLRQPTRRQVDDIAAPLGKLAARHLPGGFLTDDLVDITAAAAATHAYVLDESGPLVTHTAAAEVAYPETES